MKYFEQLPLIAKTNSIITKTRASGGLPGFLGGGFLWVAVSMLPILSALPSRADNSVTGGNNAPTELSTNNYFGDWFARVSRIQSEQPHWVTPLVTVTPRLEEEFRYDQFRESLPGGHTLNNFDGGKGLELIPLQNVELIVGIPAWETENTSPRKTGWSDETFLVKYRLLSANEENGNYILTAFMGLSVPNGSDDFSSHHFGFTPTIAFGKGWGDFDVQSTLGVSVPDNGAAREGAGTPIAFNTAFQYHVAKYFWPEVEANYTYYPNGEHEYKNQLFITPGLVIGRFAIWKRLGVTVAAGYQIAVTDKPLIRNNLVLSMRVPF